MTELATLAASDVHSLSDDDLRAVANELLRAKEEDRKHNQLLYYRPASAGVDLLHRSTAKTLGVGGGNRSSKTESLLVETMALATGVFPLRYADVFREKFRGPLNVRICIENFITHLHPIILPKLRWWTWTGIDQPGGARGHWGWVPKMCLKGGEWDKAWSEKLRTLTLLCRDPDEPDRILGESVTQFMSYTQEAEDFASGTFHIVHMDEPPPFQVWRENQARVLDVSGRILLSMTWPDDPAIAVDWIYDEVYEIGQQGSANKNPDVDWFELHTLDNVHLDAKAVMERTASWTDETKRVKLLGQPLRFSNRIHPQFTDLEQTWCFTCGSTCMPAAHNCGCPRESTQMAQYCHVEEFDLGDWPVVYLLDPHPRKPHAMLWVAVDPNDDLWIVCEGQLEGDAVDLKQYVEDKEEMFGLDVRRRLMDPNMGRTPSGMRREITWQDEFDTAGLRLDLAVDSETGRKRVNQYLKPDKATLRPRITFHPRCQMAILHMKRHVWDDFRRARDRDLKQQPKDKYSDFPGLLKYLLNDDPSFRMLYGGAPVIRRGGTRGGAY